MKRKFLSLTLAALCVTCTALHKTASNTKRINLDADKELIGSNSVNSSSNSEFSIMPTSVIGTEDRTLVQNTQAEGYSAIGYMLVKYPDGTYTRGTAWMASESVAITSAHCLFSAAHGGQAVEVTFIPGRDGNSYPFSTYKSTNFYVPEEYKANESETYDYGMIKFDSAIGKQTGYITPQCFNTGIAKSNFIVSGYPKNLDNNASVTYYKQYEHIGNITSSTSRKLYYKMDTSNGNSGAPVFYKNPTDGRYYAVAIHRSGNSSRNVGIRFTEDFIKNVFPNFANTKSM